jgi:hypothetical protein
MKTVRIFEDSTQVPIRSLLKDIIEQCANYSDRNWLAWTVDWVASRLLSHEELSDFFVRCRKPFTENSQAQVSMTYSDLVRCAGYAHVEQGGAFLALKPQLPMIPDLTDHGHAWFHDPRLEQQLESIADVIIQAMDLPWWDVTAADQDLMTRLTSRFKSTEIHDHMME